MAKEQYSRYVWLIDTIKRYGAISRHQLDECWVKSRFSKGEPLPRRTFYNYRRAIEEIFKLTIEFDSRTNSYSITENSANSSDMTDWMLNTASITDILSDSRDIAQSIFLEDVPSARRFLPTVIEAIKTNHTIVFDYHPYSRTTPTTDIRLDPYFLKIFRQRWYITGRNHSDNSIKTYALDRIISARLSVSTFRVPDDFDAGQYVKYSFGIVFNRGEIKDIVIKADSQQAKYLRALPLHHTQTEEISDTYSIFNYRMKISDDLITELLSYGPRITVLRPPELRAIMIDRLTEAVNNYRSMSSDNGSDYNAVVSLPTDDKPTVV